MWIRTTITYWSKTIFITGPCCNLAKRYYKNQQSHPKRNDLKSKPVFVFKISGLVNLAAPINSKPDAYIAITNVLKACRHTYDEKEQE